MSLLLLGLLFAINGRAAAPTNDDGLPPVLDCPGPGMAEVQALVAAPDLPLVGCRVRIEAGRTRLYAYNSVCHEEIFTPPADLPVQWALVSWPTGAAPEFSGASTLATLALPRVGQYRVRFTVCTNGNCTVSLGEGSARRAYSIAGAASAEVVINAVNQTSIPPEVYPELPGFVISNATPRSVFDQAALNCACSPDGGGLVDPQWVTVGPFDPNAPYAKIEGEVFNSWMATKDSPFNHSGAGPGNVMDVNIRVDVDPPYRWRVATRPEFDSPYVMTAEWERTSIPERVRPVYGDRVAAWGIWIHDCGHEPFYTELHPLVGLAVMRPRAIELPSNRVFRFETPTGFTDATVGNNVWVPGIVTDIWFNRDAGEITGNCSTTGLHQPGRCLTNFNGQVYYPDGDCIRGPHPIDRLFNFNIYLPRNPRLIACEHGLDLPEPAIFIETNGPSSFGGAEPIIQVVHDAAGATYLNVTLDLTGYTADTYSRRITAAWVYPSPNNWELQKLRVRLDKLDVHDDLDDNYTGPYSDGDWGLWVQLPNVNQEWTRILDGSDNAHGVMTFNPTWETGRNDPVYWRPVEQLDSTHALGADVVIIPPFRAYGAVTTYESDYAFHQDPGRVTFDLALLLGTPRRATSDKGNYTLHYTVSPLAPPAPVLTSAALQFHNRYQITCTNAFGWRPGVPVARDPMSVNSAVVPGIAASDMRAWRGEGQPGGRFGSAMAGGDFDGDGASDLFVIEPVHVPAGPFPRASSALHFFRSQIKTLPPLPTWTMGGPSPANAFGRSIANAGDVNGDGLPDLIVGSPGFDNSAPLQTDSGAAYLWLGRSNLASVPLVFANPDWTRFPAAPNLSEYGFAVASAGDVNNDGYGDVIIGAPGWDNSTAPTVGRVFIYHGSPTGLMDTASTTIIPPVNNGQTRFGAAVTGLGDFNGDGYGDVAIGAPNYGAGQSDAGAVFVYFGSANGIITNHAARWWFLAPNNATARFGEAVAAAGDVNGDNLADLLVGAPGYGEDEILGDYGAAFLYLGGPVGSAPSPAWTRLGTYGGARFGTTLAGVGDLDRDGYDDVVVGAPGDYRTHLGEGSVAMFRGHATAAGLSATPDWEEVGQRDNAQLGSAVAAAGDVNHDGSPEFVYSALGWPSCDAVRGVAWLRFGRGPLSVRPIDMRVMRAVGEEPLPWLDPDLPNLEEILGAADQDKLAIVLAELRSILDARVLNTQFEAEALLRLAPVAAAAPTNLWNKYFGDLVFDNGAAWFVDCGATNEYRDALGRLWTPDSRYLVDGNAPLAVVAQSVDDSLLTDHYVPNEMLRSERWFNTNLLYAVSVPPGRYRVVLYFAETCLPCVGPAWGGTGCTACSRVFDVEYEGVRTNGVNPADRAVGAPLDGVGAVFKATEIISTPFDVNDGVFHLTLFDRGAGNPPENPSIKGFVLLRLPPVGKTFNRPFLSFATSIRGGTDVTLLADLKGHLALVQSGLGSVHLEMSGDLSVWQQVSAPPALLGRQARFTVPRSTSSQFFRAVLDLPDLLRAAEHSR